MPRTRAPDRLEDIADGALDVFLQKGYRRTRMTDVAETAGVSPGLLYTYAASKEALFRLVLLRELGVGLDQTSLPAPTPSADDVQALIRRALRDLGTIPTLDAAADTADPTDASAELAAIVGEHYDRVQRYRRVISLVERSSFDWPELADRFYRRGRRPFVSRLGEYIARRVKSGHFAPVPDPDVAARFVIETVAWFANHRYGDYDGAQIDDRLARDTVIRLIVAAFVRRAERPA